MAEYHESASIDISVPRERVFQFVMDIPNLPNWSGAFDTLQDLSDEPIKVGSAWTAISHFMGREIVSQCRVTEYLVP